MTPVRHSFTVKSIGIRNRLISKCFVYPLWTGAYGEPQPPWRQYSALWDTGATSSMVTKRVVDDLGLQPELYDRVLHVAGVEEMVPLFHINLVVLDGLHFPGVSVLQGMLFDCDVLIGMDIINRGDFAISNRNGATTFSFRIPSVEDFDFAAADNMIPPSPA